MLILQITLSQLGQSWSWMLQLKSAVSPATHHWRSETWWWNEQVGEAIQEKRAWFKVYNALKKGGISADAKEIKTAYIDVKHVAKYAREFWARLANTPKLTFGRRYSAQAPRICWHDPTIPSLFRTNPFMTIYIYANHDYHTKQYNKELYCYMHPKKKLGVQVAKGTIFSNRLTCMTTFCRALRKSFCMNAQNPAPKHL